MHQIIRKILKKMIKKPHLDHTQALSSYVSGSLGTLKKCFYGLEIFSNPLIDATTKRFNKSRSKKKKMKRKPHPIVGDTTLRF
ncbi:hypothetical protein [Helicobacter pylori]|uniref:hypothetical protein n=1 Tax=Helicobacter pylori TaxID=210 RepID=UPI003F910DC6